MSDAQEGASAYKLSCREVATLAERIRDDEDVTVWLQVRRANEAGRRAVFFSIDSAW